jgi:hypothetical protein
LDLGWIDPSKPEIRRQRRREMHCAAQGDAEKIAHPIDLTVEIGGLRLEPLLAREGKELRGFMPRSAAVRINSTHS